MTPFGRCLQVPFRDLSLLFSLPIYSLVNVPQPHSGADAKSDAAPIGHDLTTGVSRWCCSKERGSGSWCACARVGGKGGKGGENGTRQPVRATVIDQGPSSAVPPQAPVKALVGWERLPKRTPERR